MLGATGRFGRIVDVLLARGHRVRVGVRDRRSSASVRLRDVGAQVVHADFDDADSIESAARGLDAVFASGTAHKAGPDGEARHGINLANALAAAHVAHLVFVSGAGADRPTGVPVLESKRTVEQQIADRGLPATVLAPAYLMENIFNPWNLAVLQAGRLPTPVPPSLALQQVSVSDVVALAALAIECPDEMIGERIGLASDAPTGEMTAAVLSKVAGVQLIAQQLARDGLPAGLVALFEWLERDPAPIHVPHLRRRFEDVSWHDFETWARDQQERLSALLRAPTQREQESGT